MENKRLREDLEDINNHYQELFVVSKEALKRKRKTKNMCEELEQKIPSFNSAESRTIKES